jgi:Restriction alleviation protein Lar
MMDSENLKPCPACGKQAGKLIENKSARFAFRVQCGACGWMTDAVKLGAVAVKLWNEAKRESKARARPK